MHDALAFFTVFLTFVVPHALQASPVAVLSKSKSTSGYNEARQRVTQCCW